MEGLETVVRGGITDHYNDVLWTYYHGPSEALELEADPTFQRLLKILDELNIKPTGKPVAPGLNVRPASYELARNMSAKRGANSNGTTGGGFYDLQEVNQRRFVAAPAHNIPEGDDDTKIDISLENGICFDGASLIIAMFREGFIVETIRNREGAPKAYRQKQFGEFFMGHVL